MSPAQLQTTASGKGGRGGAKTTTSATQGLADIVPGLFTELDW